MIAALPRGKSVTLVSLVCLAGAVGAGLWALRTSDQPAIVAAAALISGLTGVLVAVAMILFPRSPRSTGAESKGSARTGSGHVRPTLPPQQELWNPTERLSLVGVPIGQPPPMLVAAQPQPTPGPRHGATPPMTDGEPPTAPIPLLGGSTTPPPDPRAAALVAEHRGLLAEHRAVLVQRATLLRGMAELVGRLPDEFAWQVAKLLEQAGARNVMPGSGAPFDPVQHSVLGTQPTSDPAVHDTVARTLRAGWLDGDQVLIPANVVVYALGDQVEQEPDDDQQ